MRQRHLLGALSILIAGIFLFAPAPSLAASTLFSTKTRLVQVKGQPQVYAIVDGKKHYVRSLEALHSYAFLKKSIEPISERDLNELPETNLIMSPLGPRVYLVDHKRGLKLWIPTEGAFVKGGHRWEHIVRVTGDDSRAYRNARLIKSPDSETIYYLDNDHPGRHAVTNPGDLAAVGLSINDVLIVPPAIVEGYTLEEPFNQNLVNKPPVSAGTLSMSAGADPAAATIPAGTIRNPVWRVDFSASSSPVTLYSFTVTKRGIINDNAVERLRLVDSQGVAIGNPLHIVEGKARFEFPQPITLLPGQPQTFRLVAGFRDIPTQSTFGLAIVSAQDINANAPINAKFPLTSAEHRIIAGTGVIGKLIVTPADLSSTERSIIVGSTNQALARFTISAKGGDEHILLDRLHFTIIGGAEAPNFTKYRLVDDQNKTLGGTIVGSGYRLTADLSKSPYVINRGETRTLTLRADVTGGQDRSAQFTLQGDEDVQAHGSKFGLSILPTAGAPTFSFPIGSGVSGGANTVAIKPGQVVVAAATTSPATAIARGSRGVVLGVFEVRALGQAVRWESADIVLTAAGSRTPLDGVVSLREKGKSGFGSVDASAALSNTRTIFFSPQPIIAAGKTLVLEVVVDIPQAAKLGDAYSVTISNGKFLAGTDNGRISFTPPISSAVRAVQELNLSVRLDPKFVAVRPVAGKRSIKIGRVLMQASGNESIRVEQVTLAAAGGANVQFSNGFSNLKFGSTTIATPTGSPFIFAINMTLSPNRETGYDIVVDTGTAAANQLVSLSVQEVVAYGATSRAPVAVQTDGKTTPVLTVVQTKLTVAPDSTFVTGPVAKAADSVLARFVVTASEAEDITLSQIVVAETSGSSGFSVSRGYKNLRLKNASTDAALSGVLANPVAGAGGNQLSGFKIKAGQSITVNVVADTLGAATGDNLQLVILSMTAKGVTSSLVVPVAGLPATMPAVTF